MFLKYINLNKTVSFIKDDQFSSNKHVQYTTESLCCSLETETLDRNDKELTEADEIKKRLQKYTEELYKKGLNDPDNHDGVVTHLEPDILECEAKWALGSISMNKASGGDGILAELF